MYIRRISSTGKHCSLSPLCGIRLDPGSTTNRYAVGNDDELAHESNCAFSDGSGSLVSSGFPTIFPATEFCAYEQFAWHAQRRVTGTMKSTVRQDLRGPNKPRSTPVESIDHQQVTDKSNVRRD